MSTTLWVGLSLSVTLLGRSSIHSAVTHQVPAVSTAETRSLIPQLKARGKPGELVLVTCGWQIDSMRRRVNGSLSSVRKSRSCRVLFIQSAGVQGLWGGLDSARGPYPTQILSIVSFEKLLSRLVSTP